MIKNSESLLAFIFKTINDPNLGQLSFTKIMNGKIQIGDSFITARNKNPIKITKIYRNRANEYINIEEASTGDIIVLGDLSDLSSGEYICEKNNESFGYLMKGFDKVEPLYH